MTMTLVETIEVGAGGAASIEFTSIPQDADDLLLVVSLRSTWSSVNIESNVQFNSDTGANYSWRRLYGTGSAVSSTSSTSTTGIQFGDANGNTATANTFGNAAIYIPNYVSSQAKAISADTVIENNATSGSLKIVAGLWNSTSAITSIRIYGDAGNFMQYSTASLYKITKA